MKRRGKAVPINGLNPVGVYTFGTLYISKEGPLTNWSTYVRRGEKSRKHVKIGSLLLGGQKSVRCF